ncbi:type 1 glutamine amidotransferase domain-containing protein [Polaribacter porphyrae]|uniref:DJ-1/PfpI domain-containing protein n=1 Tax=Polaribacter porphyrae TaxID=1137780 RepID=A0A2S7WK63_9FLAO|nr:type 1 glutamine amidotransferase domain-containing protein [Polaribacter porphyrae]PQJ78007.1 hypothetical protein BTO18_01855 [Polaribacter porphyrae]
MRFLFLCFCFFVLTSCNQQSEKVDIIKEGKVLFVVSNQHTYGNTNINAANHFGEIVFAYDVFIKNKFEVDFVSPNGGAIPIGYLSTSDSIQKKYIYDAQLMDKLKTTKAPNQIQPKNYKAIYYVGGGAAMFGVPENIAIQKIASDIYKNNGILSAVCHGTAGIVNIKNANGKFIYQGKNVNGFPDKFENKKAKYYETFPFSIEEIIKERGGKFSYSENGWDNYFKVDGRIITGQDPTAAAAVAKEIVKQIQ